MKARLQTKLCAFSNEHGDVFMRTTLARFALLATLLCTSNLARADDRGAAAGAAVGGVAGALLGGPIGAAIGAGIGTVAGGAVTSPAAMQMVLPGESFSVTRLNTARAVPVYSQ